MRMTAYSDKLAEILVQLDPSMTPTSESYGEALVLLASIEHGSDEEAIARELQFDPEFVALVGNRLRTAKIWRGDGLSDAAWKRWNEPEGGVAFFCDLNVANGMFIVDHYEGDEPQYKNSPAGEKRVRQLLASGPRA